MNDEIIFNMIITFIYQLSLKTAFVVRFLKGLTLGLIRHIEYDKKNYVIQQQ